MRLALLTLAGTAPIAIKTIEVNGVAYPPSWTGVTDWSEKQFPEVPMGWELAAI